MQIERKKSTFQNAVYQWARNELVGNQHGDNQTSVQLVLFDNLFANKSGFPGGEDGYLSGQILSLNSVSEDLRLILNDSLTTLRPNRTSPMLSLD